jgi:hypothetical protein
MPCGAEIVEGAVAICATLGTAPAATSTPARTTVIKARLVEIPRVRMHASCEQVRTEQFRLQFQDAHLKH